MKRIAESAIARIVRTAVVAVGKPSKASEFFRNAGALGAAVLNRGFGFQVTEGSLRCRIVEEIYRAPDLRIPSRLHELALLREDGPDSRS